MTAPNLYFIPSLGRNCCRHERLQILSSVVFEQYQVRKLLVLCRRRILFLRYELAKGFARSPVASAFQRTNPRAVVCVPTARIVGIAPRQQNYQSTFITRRRPQESTEDSSTHKLSCYLLFRCGPGKAKEPRYTQSRCCPI